MIVPDVNLLLYAHIDAFPAHERARAWWEGLLNADRPVGIAPVVAFGFVRIAASARVFDAPMEAEVALGHVERWLERPHANLLHPGPRHAALAFDLLRRLGTAGHLTTDVQLAAHAIESRGEVHSNDSDFARIPDVRWVNPLRSSPRPA